MTDTEDKQMELFPPEDTSENLVTAQDESSNVAYLYCDKHGLLSSQEVLQFNLTEKMLPDGSKLPQEYFVYYIRCLNDMLLAQQD
jgi:hypothetical protein